MQGGKLTACLPPAFLYLYPILVALVLVEALVFQRRG